MGSKISKAVRRPPPATEAAAAVTIPPGNKPPATDVYDNSRQETISHAIHPGPSARADASSSINPEAQHHHMDSRMQPDEDARNTSHIDELPTTTLDSQDTPANIVEASAGNVPLPPSSPDGNYPRPPEVSCIICSEKFNQEEAKTGIMYPCKSCESPWCTTCVKDSFVKACKDLTRMPPRCCTLIQLHTARPYLTKDEAADFRAKYEEWSTPNPLYCPDPSCSAFISQRTVRQFQDTNKSKRRVDSMIGMQNSQVVSCPLCDLDICTNCRQSAHPNAECNMFEFGTDKETAELLKSWGYKRCPKCGNGVRRMYGCNHIGCLCGAHWCWVCQKNRDDCDGNCFESEDEGSVFSVEDDDVAEPVTDEGNENAETGNSTDEVENNTTEGNIDNSTPQVDPVQAGSSAEEGEASTASSAEPIPAPQPRNLDGRSQGYWENSGFDFGDEPTDDYADRSWACFHKFSVAVQSFAKSLHDNDEKDPMECTQCWTTIHPTMELPAKIPKNDRMVVRRLSRRHDLRHTRYLTGRRVNPIPNDHAAFSQSVPSDAFQEPMDSLVASNNGDRVVDTYGNVITTTDWVLNPNPPRRASFDFSFTAEPRISFDLPDITKPHPHLRFQPSFGSASSDDEGFSLAHECKYCGVLVCEACKKIMLADVEKREAEQLEDSPKEYVQAL